MPSRPAKPNTYLPQKLIKMIAFRHKKTDMTICLLVFCSNLDNNKANIWFLLSIFLLISKWFGNKWRINALPCYDKYSSSVSCLAELSRVIEPRIASLKNKSVVVDALQEISVFRDFMIIDPRYFMIIFKR